MDEKENEKNKVTAKDGYDFAKCGLKFFSVEELGLSLDKEITPAVVKSVTAESTFSKILRPGDKIVSINGRATDLTDDVRRTLREACILGYAFVTRVRGSEPPKTVFVKVELPPTPKPK